MKKSIKDKPISNILLPIHGAKNNSSPQDNPPVFSLWHIKDSHCVKKCVQEEKAAFADKLRELSQLTWMQIMGTQRHGNGYEKIERSAINETIPPHITEDVHIIAFRFYKKAPMIGYRDPLNRSIFHIVWLDREYNVYNHG
ncbi:MAG: hypothetical protein HZB79_03685 [Deltaproteobacteria bacterium]|nr:hypothetical protein [Deltaproteobacteria bacterium]